MTCQGLRNLINRFGEDNLSLMIFDNGRYVARTSLHKTVADFMEIDDVNEAIIFHDTSQALTINGKKISSYHIEDLGSLQAVQFVEHKEDLDYVRKDDY